MATHKSGADRSPNLQLKCRNPNYSGPNLETIASSAVARARSIPYLEEYDYLKDFVLRAKLRFASMFIEQLNLMGSKLNESWVDACKARERELAGIFAAIISSDDSMELVVAARTARGVSEHIFSLSGIGYCPKKFQIIGIDEDNLVDLFISASQPKFYGQLFVAMFKVADACREAMYRDENLAKNLIDLALSILEIAGLYNETNPDSERWYAQELATLSILTHPPTREDDEELDVLFQHVLEDIRDGKKPYVSELSKAIRSTRRYCQSKFSDKDYYFSIKSDPAYIPGFKYKQSLIKSMVEVDPWAGHPFDECVGYVSAYNKSAPEGYEAPLVKTIHIPNPGKYKTRAIHLLLSSLQDRGCYIHNRLAAVLAAIPSDCTKRQEEGQAFTLKISDPSYREERGWSSVLAFDWSNATDKMWQTFQEECLRLIFPEPVVQFWHDLSTCEKVFYHRNGKRTKYVQINGQPQGALGSFEAFAFAHHVIMLMTMSLAHLEDSKASDFYRVLGDDSIISSIKWDPNNVVGDSYCRICAWANMEINRTKSTEVLCTDKVALVDFAKVKILNGNYASPIPGRLANRIGKHNCDYYAFSAALWYAKHGYPKQDWILGMVDHYYQDPIDNKLAHLLIESGILTDFRNAGFYDPVLNESDICLAQRVCLGIERVKASLLMSLLGDKVKENLDILEKETDIDSLRGFIPEDLDEVWDRIENIDHKVNIALELNLSKEEVIREILSCSEDQSKVLAASIMLSEEEFSVIKRTLTILNTCSESPQALSLFKTEILSLEKDLDILDRLQYRSLYKRNALSSIIMKRSIRTFKCVFENLVVSLEVA